jgi:photosystem II reaction center protein PsbP
MGRNLHPVIRMSRPRRLLLPCAGIGLLGFLAAGCGSSSPPPNQAARVTTPQRGVPSGYTEFRDSARGYSIAVPSTWIQVNVRSPQAAAVLARVAKEDPKAAAALGGSLGQMQKEDMSLLAAAADGAGANMIATTSGAESYSRAQMSSLLPSILGQYARLGATVSGHQLVTVDGDPALRFEVSIALKGRTVRETQFVIITGGWAYTLTLDETTAATTAEIVSTLRFS